MVHGTTPSHRELSGPNIIMPGLRNSADLQIANRVPGHMEFTVLPGKLTSKHGNCVDATDEVMGVPIISPHITSLGSSAMSPFMALQEDSFLERSSGNWK